MLSGSSAGLTSDVGTPLKLLDMAKSNTRADAEITSGVHKVRCDDVQISSAINSTGRDLLGTCICAI